MIIQPVDESVLEELYRYYEKYTQENTKYSILNISDFRSNLIDNKMCLFAKNSTIQGMISGVIEKDTCYITMVYGNSTIMKQLIQHFLEQSQVLPITNYVVHFFNPVSLPWMIRKGVTHPCYPGVLENSKLHQLLQEVGFNNHSVEEVYFLDLIDYLKPNSHPLPDGITIELYDSDIHTGFQVFLEHLHADHWKQVLMENKSQVEPLPVVVALDHKQVIGFAGPIKTEDSNRGYFAGIGLLDEYRKQHIGSTLFYCLCEHLREIGSLYMTFYTGETNPAKYVYLHAGATVIERFVTMKRSL